MDLHSLIKQAIRERRCIRFEYAGKSRVVEPHTYGIDTAKQEALCGFQVAGGSSTTSFGWKTFRLSEMSRLAVTSRGFAQPRFDYRRGDKAFMEIYAEL